MKGIRRYMALAAFVAIGAIPPLGALYWSGYFSQPATSAFEILRAPERSTYAPPHVNRADDYWNNSPMLKSNPDGIYNITWRIS